MSTKSTTRFPLKRVRPENENRRSNSSSTQRTSKKFCRQISQDSAFVEAEKSSDERAFDLFHHEYFPQFRSFFKNSSIVRQLVEHLWTNMTDFAKVSFVKKILKDQGASHLSTIQLNNEENEMNSSRTSINSLTFSKYNRTFINDFLTFVKHFGTTRFVDPNSSNKSKMPLRRSSRIRRAPTKCSCSSCVIHQTSHDEDFTPPNDDDSQGKTFRELFDHFLQLDDEIVDKSMINDENSAQLVLSEVSKMIDENSSMENADLSSFDFLQDATTLFDENLPIFSSESFLSSSSISDLIPEEIPQRRTFVILTELDEPFFGPYPIEFTITI